jgi:hypothetical protein
MKLLKIRHARDLFVPECKDGPTQAGPHRRMDAWVMAKSWAHPCVTAYEVKVTRGDFLSDEKWEHYLPLCNCFYFVCPPGVIDPGELPDGVGLLCAARTGTRLYTRRKAAKRDVAIPEDVWRYILMCRVRIVDDTGMRRTKLEEWTEWLNQKREAQHIGHLAGRRLQELYREALREKEGALALVAEYDAIRERLRELGFNPDHSVGLWKLDERLDSLLGRATPRLRSRLRGTVTTIERLLESLGGEEVDGI